ncbi:hypothetical protein DES52_101478 [Deinococcus yavapaiensis KR-236]|uniref:Uncharacterized protein n=1 Tax=Deinococcus yavapaiensis KR-236 TaxID=694435 RepID=A0A318SDF5_9DEIO|nr:hypothetical protein DES52_101478 [Deinococcus yavapaiensis KR-236]
MKTANWKAWGQRVFALASVFAVVFGLAPHNAADRKGPSLTPPPLSELRSFAPLPPITPHEVGDVPILLKRFAPLRSREPSASPSVARGFTPSPRTLSGVSQLEGA